MKIQKTLVFVGTLILVSCLISGMLYFMFQNESNFPDKYDWISDSIFFADKGISGVITDEFKRDGYIYLPIELSLIFSGKNNKYWGNLEENSLKVFLFSADDKVLDSKEVNLVWDDLNKDFYIEDLILGEEHMMYETTYNDGYLKIINESNELRIPLKFYKVPKIDLDTSNWRIHTDDDFDYKISYPSEFSVFENPHSFGLIIDYDNEGSLQRSAINFSKADTYTNLERIKNEHVFFKKYNVQDEIYYFYSNFDPYNENEKITDLMMDSFYINAREG